MSRKWWLLATGPALMLFILGPPVRAAEEKSAAKKEKAEQEFKLTAPIVASMEEVSAFGKDEVGGRTLRRDPRGASVALTPTPNPQVRAYPKLKSKRPLYGSVTFDGNYYDRSVGKVFCFVLDESGDSGKAKKAESEDESEIRDRDSSPVVRLPNAKLQHDRLYFDLNGDLDLTNDQPVKLADKPPFEGLPAAASAGMFADLLVPVDFGPPVGVRPFAVVPRLQAYSAAQASLSFLPKTARRGTIRFGEDEYIAILSQSRIVSGRFDRAFVDLQLVPADPSTKAAPPVRAGVLGELRKVNDQWIEVSATPLGDRLTIGPCRGEMGVLEIGPGGRAITDLGLTGNLVSRDRLIRLGEPGGMAPAELPRRYTLPVGDYFAVSLTAQYGRLRFESRMLTDLNPAPTSSPPKPLNYPIHVRADKPLVLEFSGKPEVVFMNPSKEKTFKPGDTVAIRAMLTEPHQGIMITGLYDTTKKKGTVKYRAGGKDISVPDYVRMDPTIVIRNSQGEQVAQGTMPFG